MIKVLRNPKKTTSAGGVVMNENGKIIVVAKKDTRPGGDIWWSLPKGHIEAGEELIEAAKREIYEETGITDLELVKKLGVYERSKFTDPPPPNEPSEWKTIHIFLFRTKETSLKPIHQEHPEARWASLEEASKLISHPEDKKFFESTISELS